MQSLAVKQVRWCLAYLCLLAFALLMFNRSVWAFAAMLGLLIHPNLMAWANAGVGERLFNRPSPSWAWFLGLVAIASFGLIVVLDYRFSGFTLGLLLVVALGPFITVGLYWDYQVSIHGRVPDEPTAP